MTVHPVLGRLPHALSMARVGLVLLTYFVVLQGDIPLFAVLVLSCVLTDILDGPLARAYGTADRFGANVDTTADIMFYLSFPAWVWFVRPEVIRDNVVIILSFAVLYLVAAAAMHWRFGALGVHNKLSRASGTSGVIFLLATILWGFHTWLYVAVMLVVVADLAQRYSAIARGPPGKARRSGM